MGGAALGLLGRKPDADGLRRGILARHAAALEGLHGERDVFIFGTGLMGRMVLRYCQSCDIKLRGALDNDPARQGATFEGLPVLAAEMLAGGGPVVIIASQYLHDIDRQLEELGVRYRLPYPVLFLQDPANMPPEESFAGICEDLAVNRSRYDRLFARLADERSREVLDSLLLFRMTLDPRYPWQALDPHEQYFDPVIELSQDEVFVDGGAYDGDTAARFIDRSGGSYNRLLLFEPDRELLERARERLRDQSGIEYFACGLGARQEVLSFNATGGPDGRLGCTADTHGQLGRTGDPDGRLGRTGGLQVPVAALDGLTEERITYLKLDVEGAEPDALRGAAGHLVRSRPKLAVAVYHSPSHLWEIPELINTLCPGYRFYLRHYSQTALESILYAVPDGPGAA